MRVHNCTGYTVQWRAPEPMVRLSASESRLGTAQLISRVAGEWPPGSRHVDLFEEQHRYHPIEIYDDEPGEVTENKM